MAENDSSKRRRVDSDNSSPTESPESTTQEAKRLRADILDMLDEEDAAGDRDPAIEDLATVMKSLEDEISQTQPLPPPILVSESDSGESPPDLGYLLEASDDELGLPPTSSSLENDKGSFDVPPGETETVGFGQMWGFDDGYDALGFGIGAEDKIQEEGGPIVFEGLFDYPDGASDPSVFSDYSSWRTESLPAL